MFSFSRPTIVEIDLDSLAYNYHHIRSRVHSEATILAVVKDKGLFPMKSFAWLGEGSHVCICGAGGPSKQKYM